MIIKQKFIWILHWTIFWAMGVMKKPIYLYEILGSGYMNILRNYIRDNSVNLTLNMHDIYILLEWIYEVRENIYEDDFETVTWYSLDSIDELIKYLESILYDKKIEFKRIKCD